MKRRGCVWREGKSLICWPMISIQVAEKKRQRDGGVGRATPTTDDDEAHVCSPSSFLRESSPWARSTSSCLMGEPARPHGSGEGGVMNFMDRSQSNDESVAGPLHVSRSLWHALDAQHTQTLFRGLLSLNRSHV